MINNDNHSEILYKLLFFRLQTSAATINFDQIIIADEQNPLTSKVSFNFYHYIGTPLEFSLVVIDYIYITKNFTV